MALLKTPNLIQLKCVCVQSDALLCEGGYFEHFYGQDVTL